MRKLVVREVARPVPSRLRPCTRSQKAYGILSDLSLKFRRLQAGSKVTKVLRQRGGRNLAGWLPRLVHALDVLEEGPHVRRGHLPEWASARSPASHTRETAGMTGASSLCDGGR